MKTCVYTDNKLLLLLLFFNFSLLFFLLRCRHFDSRCVLRHWWYQHTTNRDIRNCAASTAANQLAEDKHRCEAAESYSQSAQRPAGRKNGFLLSRKNYKILVTARGHRCQYRHVNTVRANITKNTDLRTPRMIPRRCGSRTELNRD